MPIERGTVEPERLAAIPLFAQLRPEERARVAELAEEVVVPSGETIDSERDFAYEFFIIDEGQAEVVRDGRRLAELGSACSSPAAGQPQSSRSRRCG